MTLTVESASDPCNDSCVSFSKSAVLGAATVALSACGGGDSGPGPAASPNVSGGTTTGAGGPPSAASGVASPSGPPVFWGSNRKPQSDAEAARFLLQASFSASSGSIDKLRAEGFEHWLNREMRQENDSSARQYFAARGLDRVDENRFFFNTTIGDNMIWAQLLDGGSELRKRVAFALSQFFVVSLNELQSIHWRAAAIGEYWDLLNRHAFGNYRELLEDITLNPAMGVFLDTRSNWRADPRTGRVPDENYAREVMQLFSIGLVELNQDGTPRLYAGRPVETFDNNDVSGLAKVFTGYDLDCADISRAEDPANPAQTILGVDHVRRPMTADAARWSRPRSTGFHSEEEKRFLGLTIPPGTNAKESLRLALDHLFAHPNVGPFFARQMIQRLVTSNPSPSYVSRVAAVFANNGKGQRGDLATVFKAILLDEEARAPSNVTKAGFGKLREPVIRFVQLARTFGVRSISGNYEVANLSDPARRLGQSPLRAPSVFNFFRPGFVPPNSRAAANSMLAPEFQIANETSVAGYVNFLEQAVDMSGSLLRDLVLTYSAELPIAHDASRLLDHLDLVLTASQLSQSVKSVILSALESTPVQANSPDADKLRRIHTAVMLIMAATDYLIQK